jgi:hypothetical protein
LNIVEPADPAGAGPPVRDGLVAPRRVGGPLTQPPALPVDPLHRAGTGVAAASAAP